MNRERQEGGNAARLLDSALDAELLAEIARQDAEAFTRFYTKTSDILYSTALSILRDPELAEDVLQDVYTQIWKNAQAYDPALGRPIAWVVSLTRNKALDRLRSSKRRTMAMKELAEATGSSDNNPNHSQRSGDVKDAVELVRATLRVFPAKQRRAMELALFEGLSHGEVAAVLKEPLGTVKAWIRRGIIELRDRLGKYL